MHGLLVFVLAAVALVLYYRRDLYKRPQINCTGPCGGSGGRNFASPFNKNAFGDCVCVGRGTPGKEPRPATVRAMRLGLISTPPQLVYLASAGRGGKMWGQK
jgi:hypothetical protein